VCFVCLHGGAVGLKKNVVGYLLKLSLFGCWCSFVAYLNLKTGTTARRAHPAPRHALAAITARRARAVSSLAPVAITAPPTRAVSRLAPVATTARTGPQLTIAAARGSTHRRRRLPAAVALSASTTPLLSSQVATAALAVNIRTRPVKRVARRALVVITARRALRAKQLALAATIAQRTQVAL